MNTPKLRSKRIILPAIAGAAVLAIGGPVWAATASDVPQGNERDRVAAAAIEAVGGGTAVDVETSDDSGEAYEVEVRTDGGAEIDVELDKDLNVVSKDTDDPDDREDSDDRDDRDDGDDRDDASETDDRALSATERTSAEKAAVEAVGGGTVVEVEASDDSGEAYEVAVRDADDVEWDVELDADYTVLDKAVDN